jgi:hypothetical protein
VKAYHFIAPLLVTLAVFTASACTSRPAIRLDRNPTVAFSAYQTFAFANANMETSNRYVSLFDGRMREATRQELERRNYVFNERNPDLLVELASGRLSEGTVILTLFDSRQHTRVWRGLAVGDRSLDELTVSELFVGFPINQQGGDLASSWN